MSCLRFYVSHVGVVMIVYTWVMLNQTMLIDSSKKVLKQFGYFKSKLEYNEILFLQETHFTSNFRRKQKILKAI